MTLQSETVTQVQKSGLQPFTNSLPGQSGYYVANFSLSISHSCWENYINQWRENVGLIKLNLKMHVKDVIAFEQGASI